MSRESVVHIEQGVSGYFKLVTHKADAQGNPVPGSSQERTGWVKNLITNHGMNALGDPSTYGNFNRGCAVGSGNTAPNFADTLLANRVASAVRFAVTQGRDLVATPNYVFTRSTYRFNAGVATGNLSEVGLVAATNDISATGGVLNANTPLSTRALIVDGNGNPTVITVLADEILDVIYEVRLTIPSTDVTGVVNIAGVNYSYIVRPWRIDTFPAVNSGGWGLPNTPSTPFEQLAAFRQSAGHGENAIWCGASAELTTSTGASPAGTKVGGDVAAMSRTSPAYIVGSHYRDCTQSFGLGTAGTNANLAGGIGVHSFAFTHLAFQVNLEPHIPKDHTKLYSLTIRVSWTRA